MARTLLLTKPPGTQLRINWGHPLANSLVAAWVFNQGADKLNANTTANNGFFDLVHRIKLYSAGGTAVAITPNWGLVPGPTGFGYKFDPTNRTMLVTNIAGDAAVNPNLTPTAEMSFFWRGCFYGDNSGGVNVNPIFGMRYDIGSFSSPYWAYSVRRDPSVQSSVYFTHSAAGNNNFTNITSAIETTKYGRPTSFGFSRSQNAAFSKFFKDGIKIGSDTVTGALSYGTTPAININSSDNFGNTDTCNSWVDVIYVWKRALSEAEQNFLASHPYDLLQPVGRAFEFLPTGGISVTAGDVLNSPWADDLALLGGDPDFLNQAGDSLNSVWSDAVSLTIAAAPTYSDSLNNWGDASALTVGLPKEAFDTNQDKWLDGVSTFLAELLTVASTDNINNWADVVTVAISIALAVSDTLTFYDPKLEITLSHEWPYADTMTMSDLQIALFTIVLVLTDALTMSDAMAALDSKIPPGFSDSLAMLDSAPQIVMSISLQVADTI